MSSLHDWPSFSLGGLGHAALRLYGVVVVGLHVGLLLYSATWRGKLVLLTTLALALSPLVGVYWTRKSRRALLAPWAMLVLLGLACVVVNAPDGKSRPGSLVSNRFVDDDWPFPRYALSNLVPEIEQIKWGVALAPYVDPIIDQAQARRIAGVTLPLYRQMERDQDFRRLGSVMGWAYAELWGARFNYGHYYLYMPETSPGEKVPALIFIHGSAGNFKAYLWLWSRLGEARRMAVICPSFGFGNWYRAGGTEVIEAVVTHALTTLPIDPTHLYLVGLSNGGTGASRAAAATPDRYRGLIYISPIIEEDIVLADGFVRGWQERPVFIIHGDQDQRIPAQYVRERAKELAQAGVDVTYREFADEDHFLLFSQPDAVLNALQEWLDAID
jgi:pimeloyl-ACP methyl ester carboxylesterase